MFKETTNIVITQATFNVKPDQIQAFIAATLRNANQTRQEPGNIRFEVLQHNDQPTRFTLTEIYAAVDDMNTHFQTEHFKAWKNEITDLLAEAGQGGQYTPIFPSPSVWGKG